MVNGDGAGRLLGGYVLEEPLGAGGASVVYRAKHAWLGRRAAVKVLASPGDESFRERFLSESRIAAGLDHPNIVPVFDAGEADGELYIAMRCVDGNDLRTVLAEEGPLGLARTLRIVRQVASALDAAHARGLVHRDVKPANVLVSEDDHAYLSDFGVAKDATRLGLTRTGGFLGTVEYAAPEQIEGRALDGRADVYALACVAYECLAGRPPFHRESEVAVLHAHLHDARPDACAVRPELPAVVGEVLRKGLARSPHDRYSTGGAFAAALEKAARRARDDGSARRRLALIAALCACALGAGGAAGVSLAPDRGKTTTTTVTRVHDLVRTVKVADGHALSDAAFAQIQAGDFALAASYARRAVAATKGDGPADPYEGYANYNLGFALLKLGRCQEARPYLRQAEKLQPKDGSTRSALTAASRC